MVFTKNPDGSTKEIIVQLSDVHGLVVVDFATHKRSQRIMLPTLPGRSVRRMHPGSPAHGLAITPDGKIVWTTSKYYDYVAPTRSPFPAREVVPVGLHPEWLTIRRMARICTWR